MTIDSKISEFDRFINSSILASDSWIRNHSSLVSKLMAAANASFAHMIAESKTSVEQEIKTMHHVMSMQEHWLSSSQSASS